MAFPYFGCGCGQWWDSESQPCAKPTCTNVVLTIEKCSAQADECGNSTPCQMPSIVTSAGPPARPSSVPPSVAPPNAPSAPPPKYESAAPPQIPSAGIVIVARGAQITDAMRKHLRWKTVPDAFRLNPDESYMLRIDNGNFKGPIPISPNRGLWYSSNPADAWDGKACTTAMLAQFLAAAYPNARASFTDRPISID